jgi:hypothetical protein
VEIGAVESDKSLLPAECTVPQLLDFCKKLGDEVEHLQAKLTEKLDLDTLARLYIAFGSDEADNARLLAAQARGASDWLTMTQKLHNAAIELAGRLRLGCHLAHPDGLNLRCCCRSKVNLIENPGHLMHCRDLNKQGFHLSHNAVRDMLEQLARLCGFSVAKEVTLTDKHRMDLVLIDHRGRQFFVDVSGTMPTAASLVKEASRKQLSAAIAREEHKIGKYGELAKSRNATLVPFVFERFGGLSDKSIELLKLFNDHHNDISVIDGDEEGMRQFQEMLRSSVACAIHRGNQAMASLALQTSSSSLLKQSQDASLAA